MGYETASEFKGGSKGLNLESQGRLAVTQGEAGRRDWSRVCVCVCVCVCVAGW